VCVVFPDVAIYQVYSEIRKNSRAKALCESALEKIVDLRT